MAQAIFKSWFVDFEPFRNGEFVESELGMIPEGWRPYTLGEVFLQIKPGTNFQPKRITEGIPFLNVRNISSGKIDLSDAKYISENDYKSVHKNWKPEANDILLSRIGTLGLVSVIDDTDLPLAVHYNFINIKSKLLPYQFGYFLLKSQEFQQRYRNIVKQSVQEYVTIDDVANIQITLPNNFSLISDVIKQLSSIFGLIRSNQNQNKVLISLRDVLLPKLMSGEINVSDINI